MRLEDIPILRAGFFRQGKNLFTAPPKSQDALEILETGVVGIEPFPMKNTGFMNAVNPETRKSWVNIHALKVQIYKNGQPTNKMTAIPLSERSYKPLDPLKILNKDKTAKLASLKDIARVSHAQARANAKSDNPEKNMAWTIVQWCGGLMFLMYILNALQGC